MLRVALIGLLVFMVTHHACRAEEAVAPPVSIHAPDGLTPAERGLWYLLNKKYLTTDLNESEFENLWRVWPEPLKTEAESASPDERRQMAYSRYGLVEMPGRKLPMGYVPDENGGWTMNCLACHGGKVAGQAIPGLPNSLFAFQTWAQDIVEYRVQHEGRRRSEYARSLAIPLSRSNGTTNAQIFSVAFTMLRSSDLHMKESEQIHAPKSSILHHDLDAPPFWNLKKKKMLYIDGYVGKSHRVIMQFVLLPTNSAETIKGWENDFRDVLAFAENMQPPAYPWPVDEELAAKGKAIFNENCASCHGTYGPGGEYPERTVPIDEIGTDRRRLDGMPLEHRQFFESGWMGEDGKITVIESPEGYVAPPLDGIWASAPYFHNGSVPTLWHVMHQDKRPLVWKRTENGYDQDRTGLEVAEFDKIPTSDRSSDSRRTYFDTKLPGKSATGHDFPSALTEEEKRMVMEYLKTL